MEEFFFKFRCSNPDCGEYTVEEETFARFLSEKLRHRLAQKKDSAKGAVLTFPGGGCPHCRKKGGNKVSLSVVK